MSKGVLDLSHCLELFGIWWPKYMGIKGEFKGGDEILISLKAIDCILQKLRANGKPI